ncbi:CYTH domain-containing protein [Halobacillus shinanisalinarum]|uniref:CYTH domain-containing protein n=1 Tax=Halobacillus shinanisalinarum TaxID=2932258 RepID=A0ABY4GXE7_9BACI|nr:CYTH domain-containing protein [Halobacillus shinanisalinarum]UOQ92846.1 CYTH domain-containing protein [Halobacillus shinanisalinarum]
MAQEIEIEFKNLLSEDEYQKLYTYLSFETVEPIEQTNYYFETEDLKLRSKGAALRIRQKNDTWTATLKEPHPDGLLETHDQLPKETADLWMNNQFSDAPHVEKQLNKLGISPSDLLYIGSLTTHRKERQYKDTLVVLDHSFYYDESDYELELEASSKQQGEKIFAELLTTYQIAKRQTENKIKRFYQAKLKSE